MERQHIHFARGLGSTYQVKSNSKASVSKDEAGAETRAQENDEGNEESVPVVEEGEESKKVISGMRKSASIFVWVDVKRSMEMGGLPWWRSANEVILTEGDEQGMVPLEFVNRVVQRNKGCIYSRDMEGTAGSAKTSGRNEIG